MNDWDRIKAACECVAEYIDQWEDYGVDQHLNYEDVALDVITFASHTGWRYVTSPSDIAAIVGVLN